MAGDDDGDKKLRNSRLIKLIKAMRALLRFSPMTLTNARTKKNGERLRATKPKTLRRRRIDFSYFFPNPLVKVSCSENGMKTYTEECDNPVRSVRKIPSAKRWTQKGSRMQISSLHIHIQAESKTIFRVLPASSQIESQNVKKRSSQLIIPMCCF